MGLAPLFQPRSAAWLALVSSRIAESMMPRRFMDVLVLEREMAFRKMRPKKLTPR
ncbi:hypothetical protein D3C87_1695740 [compost metagenome]